TGISMDLFDGGGIWEAMNQGENTELALFATLDHLPLSIVATVIAIILISTFFITSADSATFVHGMQTTNGLFNPPFIVKFNWGLVHSLVTSVWLHLGGF